MKILFTTLLHFPPSNSSILKVFPKSFSIEIKHSYCPAKEKKRDKKGKRIGEERKGNFAFCTCLTFGSCYLPTGTIGSVVLDL